MCRIAFAILGLSTLLFAGCAKVAPAAVKAVAGQGAKQGAKVAPKALSGAVPRAVKPPRAAGGFWDDVGKEAAQQGLEYGAGQLRGDDKKKR